MLSNNSFAIPTVDAINSILSNLSKIAQVFLDEQLSQQVVVQKTTELTDTIYKQTFYYAGKCYQKDITCLDLIEYARKWQVQITNSEICAYNNIELASVAYNTIIKDDNERLEKERELDFMKSMMPISYMLWLVSFILLMGLSAIMLFYGIKYGVYVIGPWLNIILFVGSLGMTTTVIIAMFEWRKKINAAKERYSKKISKR